MALPLLTTKLRVPPTRSDLLWRPRLTERLDAGLRETGHQLILVSAPPGFGKTSLLADRARRTAFPVA